eukprot:2799690-Amphidinium_carterae.2
MRRAMDSKVDWSMNLLFATELLPIHCGSFCNRYLMVRMHIKKCSGPPKRKNVKKGRSGQRQT